MRVNDALGVLGLSQDDQIDLATVKKAYRRACQKYHPDKGGSVHMMQCVNEAFATLKSVDFENLNVNWSDVDHEYPAALNDAINKVVGLSGVIVEVCGNWVWLTGNTREHKDVIKKDAGFFWAKKKSAWYYRPENWKSRSKGTMSLDDIREKHGSQFVQAASRAQRALGH